jgi:L-cystine uptake protein TcyP (sodium:dicarboxylate symporter family)
MGGWSCWDFLTIVSRSSMASVPLTVKTCDGKLRKSNSKMGLNLNGLEVLVETLGKT